MLKYQVLQIMRCKRIWRSEKWTSRTQRRRRSSRRPELSEILQIRREKLAALQQAGRNPFEETTYEVDAYAKDINEKFDQYEGKQVSVAGRILSKRGMGKAGFIDIQDQSGRIQSYVRKDHLGDEEYEWFKKYDIGDIIGIKGEVFRTQKGQISVKADEVKLLSKSLLPLPEKMAGLEGYGTALPPAVCRFDCQSGCKKSFCYALEVYSPYAQLFG